MRLLTLMAALVWVLAACQLEGHRPSAEEAVLLQQCLETQAAQQAALEQQQSLLLEQVERLADIQGRIGHGPVLRSQLDRLEAQLAALDERLDQECPAHEPLALPGPGLQDKLVVGELEDVFFHAPDLILRARIDTGATTSSLDAREIRAFERDGDTWVRFQVYLEEYDRKVTLERPRVRRVRITQAAADEPDRREVVEMRISLGSVTQSAEFTLTDRSNMEYPVLIGRNVLRDLMVVDVAKRDAAPPSERPDPPRDQGLGDDDADTQASSADPEAQVEGDSDDADEDDAEDE